MSQKKFLQDYMTVHKQNSDGIIWIITLYLMILLQNIQD